MRRHPDDVPCRYGNEYVPMDESISAGSKVECEKALQVLEFVATSTVPRHHFVGAKMMSFTHTREDHTAALALSALCRSALSFVCVCVCTHRLLFRWVHPPPPLSLGAPTVSSFVGCAHRLHSVGTAHVCVVRPFLCTHSSV